MESGIESEDRGETSGSNQTKGMLPGKYKKVVIAFIILIIAIPAGLFIKDMINRSNPEYYLRFKNKGIKHYRQGEWEKAAKVFKKAVKYGPDRFDTHLGLGQTYLMMNNFKGAVVELEKSLKINPLNFRTL